MVYIHVPVICMQRNQLHVHVHMSIVKCVVYTIAYNLQLLILFSMATYACTCTYMYMGAQILSHDSVRTCIPVILGVLMVHCVYMYVHTHRELKRLSSVTLSPVYAHFSETLSGVWTIRALRATQRFMQHNQTRLDTNQRANYGSKMPCYFFLHLCLLSPCTYISSECM